MKGANCVVSKMRKLISLILIVVLLFTSLPIISSARGYTDWGSWSGWQDAYVSETDLRDVEEKQVVASSNYKTVYHYFRWSTQRTGGTGSWENYSGYPNYYQYDFDYELEYVGTSNGYKKYKYWYSSSNYSSVYACPYSGYGTPSYTTKEWVSDNYKTVYRYRTRTYTYSVSYNANGGSGAPSSQTKIHDSALTLSNSTPSKSYSITYNANGGNVSSTSKTVSCTFNNWKASNGSTYSRGASYTSNADTTMTAQWTNPKAGTLLTPTRTGYSFDGWYTAASGGSQVTASSIISGNTTVYAHWTPYEVKVNYYSNYATDAFSDAANAVSADKNVVVRENAVFKYDEYSEYGLHDYSEVGSSTYLGKKGYTASCFWNTEPDATGKRLGQGESITGQSLATAFGYDLTKGNVTLNLYPEWIPNTYTIKYDGNGNTAGTMAESTFEYDTTGTLKSNAFQKQSYLFNGWNTKSDGSGQSYSNNAEIFNLTDKNNEIITLYAQWLLNEYTISFDKNGGDSAPAAQAKVHGVDLKLTDELPQKTYQITVDMNTSSGSTFPAWHESKYILNAQFTRWNTSADGTGTTYNPGDSYLNDSDLVLFARWNPAKLVSLSEPTRAGYDFIGWFGRYTNVDTDFDEQLNQYGYTAYGLPMRPGMQIWGNITIHPEWRAKSYKVSFDANDGTVETTTKTVTFDGAYGELPVPVKAGHNFEGWFTERVNGVCVDKDTLYTNPSNTTLYAHWSDEKEVKSIKINPEKTKTSYYVGDNFDKSNITLIVEYVDGELREITSGFDCTEPAINKVSQKRVTVTYREATTTFNVNITYAELSEIEIDSAPTKTTYYIGDTIDSAGLAVIVKYSNGYSRVITEGFKLSYALDKSGTASVRVSYTENQKSASTSFNVNVLGVPRIHSDDTVAGYCGETVSVPIYISDNSGLMGFGLTVSYNAEALTPIAVNKNNSLPGSIGDSIATSNDNTFKVFWTGSENITEDRQLFTIDFAVDNSALGDYEIGLSYLRDDTFDEKWNQVNLQCDSVNLKIADRAGNISKLITRDCIAKTGSHFDVPVILENPSELKNLNVSLTYDKNVFNAVELIDGNGVVKSSNIDVATGTLNVNVASSSDNKINSGTLFTIRFNADYAEIKDYPLTLTCSEVEKCENSVIKLTNGPVKISSGEVSFSDNIATVPVYIKGNPGIMGLKLTFSYDSDIIKPVSAIAGNLLSQGTMDDSISSANTNMFSVVWVGSDDMTQDGHLFDLKFEMLSEDVTDTEVSVTYSQEDTYNSSWDNVELLCEKLRITKEQDEQPVLESIRVKNLPTKVEYEIGENFDITGICVEALYSNGSAISITSGLDISGFSSAAAGTKTITVAYQGKTTTFNVTVKAKDVDPNAAQIEVESIECMPGDEIEVKLSLKNNPGIAGLVVSMKYDTSVLTLKEVKKGTMFSGFTSGKNIAWDESENVTEDGVLATLVFTVSENAEAGEYSIEVIPRNCVNNDIEDVNIVAVNGKVSIVEYVHGDANGDNVIDMKDVVLIRKYIADFDYDTEMSSVAVGKGADANADGVVDMKDVVLLRKYIVNYDYDTESSTVVLGPQ